MATPRVRGLDFTTMALTTILLVGCGSDATFDPVVDDLEAAISEQAGVPVEVTCPDDIPLEAGHITDCVADDGQDRKYVRLTQDDDEGHYRWEVTSQDAP